MEREQVISEIRAGKAVLGIELGSTRIKAVLITSDHRPIAEGIYGWENQLVHGIWTYSMEEVEKDLQASYADLIRNTEETYGVTPTTFAAAGISGMMHGYLPFNEKDELLVPFRTWRNIMTEQAADELTELFDYNVPQRYSIAHLYQAVLNKESHIEEIRFFTTLAGYVHWKLTGEKVLGIGDASGIFPVDPSTIDYRTDLIEKFDALPAIQQMPWQLETILPKALKAGDQAGILTEEGAKFLDPTGTLAAGIPFCPPEGDAETGMIATNSVMPRTGNISMGTSDFAILVLERPLSRVYREIDIVASPSGELAANVHCNNCTSDLNAWVGLLGQAARLMGAEFNTGELFTRLFRESVEGNTAGILNYNYLAGEITTHIDEGRPLFIRTPESKLNLANFMRVQLYSCLATLKIGMDILMDGEHYTFDRIMGHGGFFNTPEVGQQILADAIDIPITVTDTAGQGGSWGIALLAQYMAAGSGKTLGEWLDTEVFSDGVSTTLNPNPAGQEDFNRYMVNYRAALSLEKAAAAALKGEA